MNATVVKQAIVDLQHRGLLGAVAGHSTQDEIFNCPFYRNHGGRKVQNTPSFGIAVDGKKIGAWSCFNPQCGEAGTEIFSLYAKLRGITIWEARDILATVETPLEEFFHILANIGGDREKRMKPLTAYPRVVPIESAPEALAYLEHRCIPEEIWRRAGLTYCPDEAMPERLVKDADSKKNKLVGGRRIILPINHGGIEVGFSSRAIDDDNQPKYYRPIENVNQTLYNPMGLTPELTKFVVLVEGEFDTLAVLRERLPGMGSFNAYLDQRQVSILSLFEHVYVAYDWDRAGLAGMKLLRDRWGGFLRFSFIGYNAKDPGSLPVGFGATFLDNVLTELPEKTAEEEFEEAL